MRRILFILALVLALPAAARPGRGPGLGLIVGEPTGIGFKNWMGRYAAIDGGAAWSFSENASLHFHMDYLLHRFGHLDRGTLRGRLPLYFGIGARVKLEEEVGEGRNDEDSLVGLRVPLGLAYLPRESPLEFFIEFVPVMDLLPDTDFDLNAALGARLYF